MNLVRNLFKRLSARNPSESHPAVTPAPLLLALEPRIVYDASVAAVGTTQHHTEGANNHGSVARPLLDRAHEVPAAIDNEAGGSRNTTWARNFAQGSRDAGTQPSQVVFIDPSVANYQELVAGLPAGTRYVVLNDSTDGLGQIAQYLQQHPGVESIHLVSHGADGEIQVGSTWLNEGDLAAHSATLAQIGAAMKPGGDFLIYGCDVAQRADGQMLVQQIASISHLNVAASTDATGAAALGGNWTLEYDVGQVHTPVIFSKASEAQYGYLLGQTVETYDAYANGGNGEVIATHVSSFTLDGITYTTDGAVTTGVYTANESAPLSNGATDGVLMVNQPGDVQMTRVTISLANHDAMTVTSFGFDEGFSSGTLYVAPNGDTSKEVMLTGSQLSGMVDLSANANFKGVTSIVIIDSGDSGTFTPTFNNFTYVDLSSPPTLTASSGSTPFVAGDNTASTPVAVDTGIALTDGDSTTAQTAKVSVTGNFQAGEDVLAFTNTNTTAYGDIAASYSGGVLTLTSPSGTAKIGQWQAALGAVTYTDTAITPNTATRTISFQITSDGFGAGNTVTKTVTVADTDQTPIVTTTPGTIVTYGAGAAAKTIDAGITVTDRDNTTQASGTVSISSGFHSGDLLLFTSNTSTMGDITGSYSAGTGVLTLTSASGTATLAQWDHALSAVTFSSTSTTFGNRTIAFATSDGTKTSAAATDTVNVTNPLQVTTDSGSAAFVAGDNTAATPVAIDSGLAVTDVASNTLGSATVAITGNFHGGEDVLGFTNNGATMGNIVGVYNNATGVLTLTSASSSATVTQWQNALQSVTYTDTAITPNSSTRTVSFSATDASSNVSNTATRTVTVTDTDQTPIVGTTGGTTSYVGGSAAATIDSGVTVTDRDNTTQASGTVSVSSGFHSGDVLSFTNDGSTMGNIVGTYNAATGVLMLTSASASATDAQWASALSSVTFFSSSTTYGNRTISFATSDGTKTSVARTDTVSMTAPPIITTDSGSAAFTAGDNVASTPVTIDAGVTVTDGSAATLGSAMIAITGSFHAGEDVLSFTNNGSTMGNISGSYNSSTGVLTLTSASATATLTQWQTALQSVTYTDTAVTPNNATRTISFATKDGAGNDSATATRTVTVTDTDQTPILTTTGGTTNYVGGASATTIDGGITVTDLDNTTQASATVVVTGGFHSGDTLSFTNNGTTMGNISGSYNSSTGVLTLTSASATATLSQWQAALRSVAYSSSSTAYGNRTIAYSINDGTKTSVARTDIINMTAPPTITTDAGSAAFTAGDNVASTPVAIDSGITVSDGSSNTLSSATVAITGGFHSSEDVLSFTNNGSTMGNIVGSYNSTSGVLTLTSAGATATLTQWQIALQSVTYTDTAITPNPMTRTVSFTAVDGSGNTSATATRTVTVADNDQTPIVTTTGGTTNYVGGTSAATIDGGISVTDRDNATQTSGTVSISSGFHSGDTLTFVNTSSPMFGNIVGSYNSGTGVLTLTSSGGTANDAQWAHAFSAVTFSAGSTATPGNRTISFTVNDGTKNSAAATDTVDVLGPPTITTDGGSAAFVAGDNVASTPVTVDSGLTLRDGTAPTLASATVAITGNFQSGEDVLAFTNTNSTTYGNIAASYNATTGVITLVSSGASATLTQWQAALQAVTYTDTAVTPNNATRTLSFTAVDTGAVISNTATRTVTVTDTDQTPILTTTGGTTNYVGGTSATTIDGGIAVIDRDNATQASGTVSVTLGFHSGDTLTFVNTNLATFGNIVGSYNSATGVLTLTSAGQTATDAQWANAFSAVTFSSGSTAALGNRTISFTVSDGMEISAAATDTVHVLGPPTLTTDSGSASFVAGDNTASTPVAVDSGLSLTDGSASTLASATVAITGNFHAGEDVLSFANNGTMGNITGSYNASTGVITLTSAGASATVAQWQAALEAVTYTDTAITPDASTRTISFTATDSNGNTSNTATRTVTVSDTDQTPILTTTGGTTNYVGGTSAVAIDGRITVTDLDNATQMSGTVSISTGFHSGDTLAFMNTSSPMFGNITGSYDAATGVLTLTSSGGTANDTQWANAFRAVTFSAAATATPGNRTISFTVNDGTENSAAATDTVDVLGPPTITTDAGSTAFVAGDNAASIPVLVDSGLSLTDDSASTLASATVAITGNFHAGEDRLLFVNNGMMGNITGAYDASTGVITLTSAGASATVAQWQAALEAVTYTDTAVTPNNATRTISFTAVDSNGNTSNTATRTVTVTDTDQTPIVTTTGGSSYVLTTLRPVIFDQGITVTDRGNALLQSATITISGGFQNGDMLTLASNINGAFVGNYDLTTGVMTVTAGQGATAAQWQSLLDNLQFSTSGTTAGQRTISITVSDGIKTSAAVTDTVLVLNPPTIRTDTGSSSFVAGDNAVSTPVRIDSGLSLTDGASGTLASATVAITGNFHAGEDVLSFVNDGATMGNIAASYNAGTGVMTLTSAGGTATLAQWQAAFESVTYTDTAITPNPATRTISFTAVDGAGVTSNTAARTVTVTDTDQTPIVTTSGGSVAFVAGDNMTSTPVVIDAGIAVSDRDNTTLASAAVAITGNFRAGQDVLAFANDGSTMGNITASYNAATGVLTLSSAGGTATLAQWQSALKSVTYTDTAITPDTATRTISFSVNDGIKTSVAGTRTVTVADTDQTPIVTTTGGGATFVAGDNTVSTPVVIDAGIALSDRDNTTLASATVAISGNFHAGQDVLAFTNDGATMGNIAASYNATTGVLTLSSAGGTATLAQWQAALKSVTYTDTAITPDTATRTISFNVNDGIKTSATATRTVTVLDTDQTPIVTTSGGSTAFVAADNTASTPVVIDAGIAVSDRDNTTLASAAVAITGNFRAGQDVLAFANDGSTMGNITASYNAATGVLTLSSAGGTATLAQWQSALKSVTYTDTAITPDTATRTISFSVNDGQKTSTAALRAVTVADTDQTPIVTTSGGTAVFGGPGVTTPVAIDPGIAVADRDNATLASGTVAIVSGFRAGEDVLVFANNGTTMGNITGSYNAATGVLTLSSAGGTATLAQWQAALASVSYADTNVANDAGSRTIAFSVNDGTLNSAAATRAVTVNAGFAGQTGQFAGASSPFTTPITTPTGSDLGAGEPVVLNALVEPTLLGLSSPVLRTVTFTAPDASHTHLYDAQGSTRVDAGAATLPDAIPTPFNIPVTTEHRDVAAGAKFTVALASLVGDNERIVAVTQANGRALPAWLSYDAPSGALHGLAPAHGAKPYELRLMVSLVDQAGHQTYREVVLDFGKGSARATQHPATPPAPQAMAKPSLSEQFARERHALHVTAMAPARPSAPARHI